MKKSTPISLFSFQDIITSLTGIMIVVVLIISLQLIESARAAAAIVQMQPEYEMLQKTYQQLLEKRKSLVEKIASNAEAADKYAKYSAAEIKQIIKEEEEYSKLMEEKISKAEKNLSDLVRQNAQRKQRCDQLKKELHTLSTHKNEIKELQAQLLALQKMQQNISSMIQRKSKMLRFEFSGFDTQVPLLIECNSWGFRCKRYPNGDLVMIGTPQSGSLPAHLPALQKWLKSHDVNNSYPVLLFRESSLSFHEKLSYALFEIYRKQCWGQELVGQHEEIF